MSRGSGLRVEVDPRHAVTVADPAPLSSGPGAWTRTRDLPIIGRGLDQLSFAWVMSELVIHALPTPDFHRAKALSDVPRQSRWIPLR
jgi:hypothetical protein